MAERRRIVTISSTGTVTVVADLEVSGTYQAVRGSFQLKTADRQTVMATQTRRYGGATAVAESHGNAQVAWKALVQGADGDAVLRNVDAMLGCTETPRGLFFEWRPDGATTSTYREVRGPATCQLTYDWGQYFGAKSMYVDIAIPVEPLGRGDIVTQTFAAAVPPMVVALGSAVTGDAPALADIDLSFPSGLASQGVFGLIGWTRRPGVSSLALPAPFGIFEAESPSGGTAPSGWAVTAESSFRGGSGLLLTSFPAGAGSVAVVFQVDSSLMQPDEFDEQEVDIEVWARLRLSPTLISPTAVLQQRGSGAPVAIRYSAEYGPAGKPLTKPSAGTVNRLVRLGTLKMPVKQAVAFQQYVNVTISYGAGSSGTLGMDYVMMVPVRSRALTPTGEPNDSYYPGFIKTASAGWTKRIRSDLSGSIVSSVAEIADSGLGGSPIELPPGNVDLLIAISNVVPDDPTVNTSTMDVTGGGATISGSVKITPRYWGMRG